MTLLGGPFDLVSRVSKVGYGDYSRVSKGYQVDLLSQKGLQVPKPKTVRMSIINIFQPHTTRT